MGIASRRATAAAVLLMVAVVVSAAVGAGAEEDGGAGQLGCFCDCMKNQCMTLGTGPNKFDCATACTGGCTQIGQPGQPNNDDFCGY